MIEILGEEGNIIWFLAKGRLTHDDYQQVLIPRLEQEAARKCLASVSTNRMPWHCGLVSTTYCLLRDLNLDSVIVSASVVP